MLSDRAWNKVFEIGVAKTGTTSLGRAFALLGLRHQTWDRELYRRFESGDIQAAIEVAKQHDAFEDGPWHDIDFRLWDGEFPGSKFILLEREERAWIVSYKKHFGSLRLKGFRDEAAAIQWYRDKYAEIKDYFSDRPDDLLVMDISKPDPWLKLCAFLGCPVPDEPFPYENKAPSGSGAVLKRFQILRDRLVDRAKNRLRL